MESNTVFGAPKMGGKVQVRDAFDADVHAANLTDWWQEYDQVSSGRFQGRIVELPFDGLQVFRETTNQALQQKCLVWPNSMWLGIPLEHQNPCRINGLPVKPENIMSRPGNHGFELSTPENYQLYGVVVDYDELQSTADAQGVKIHWEEVAKHGRLSLPEETLRNIRFVLSRLLDENNDAPHPSRLTRDVVMMAVLEVLSLETPQPLMRVSYQRQKSVVNLAKTYIADNTHELINITDLCKVASVSQRSLQYSFRSVLGVTPIQYLRTSRLNSVRRALLKSDADANIFDIASRWGFWHMSQFAKDYKLLFGELPSETKQTLAASKIL